jgi:hypothetical protein
MGRLFSLVVLKGSYLLQLEATNKPNTIFRPLFGLAMVFSAVQCEYIWIGHSYILCEVYSWTMHATEILEETKPVMETLHSHLQCSISTCTGSFEDANPVLWQPPCGNNFQNITTRRCFNTSSLWWSIWHTIIILNCRCTSRLEKSDTVFYGKITKELTWVLQKTIRVSSKALGAQGSWKFVLPSCCISTFSFCVSAHMIRIHAAGHHLDTISSGATLL